MHARGGNLWGKSMEDQQVFISTSENDFVSM